MNKDKNSPIVKWFILITVWLGLSLLIYVIDQLFHLEIKVQGYFVLGAFFEFIFWVFGRGVILNILTSKHKILLLIALLLTAILKIIQYINQGLLKFKH